MCLYPRLIKNPKYRVTKKNEGNVPEPSDPRVMYVPIGCGVCFECMKQKANSWKARLLEDLKEHTNGKFVTLTFSNEKYTEIAEKVILKGGEGLTGYALDNEIAKYSVEKFRERWRKKFGKSIRHWLVTELGGRGTENLHLHGILWTDNAEAIDERWGNGYVFIGSYVSERTMGYITKYVTKTDMLHKAYKPVILTSPGIGKAFMNGVNAKNARFKDGDTKKEYISKDGRKMGMPIYYKNKLYSEEEREKLWIEMLDKNERWVGGEKISADNEEEYNALVKYYRERNREAGYGAPDDWDVLVYENQRRKMLQAKRFKKVVLDLPLGGDGSLKGSSKAAITVSLRAASDKPLRQPDSYRSDRWATAERQWNDVDFD